jgi:hypothetical protein
MRRRMRLRQVGHDALPQFAALLIFVSCLTSRDLSNRSPIEDVAAALLDCFPMRFLTKLITSDLGSQKSRDQRGRPVLT